MTTAKRVAEQTFILEIPVNHPAVFCLGGDAFNIAANDLVGRVRKAAAIAQIGDPVTRRLMESYHAALSTAWGPGGLVAELKDRGVTEFHGTDYGDPEKPLATVLRECADAIERAEAENIKPRRDAPDPPAKAPLRLRSTKKTTSPEVARQQTSLKLPLEGGKKQSSKAVTVPIAAKSTKPVTRARRRSG